MALEIISLFKVGRHPGPTVHQVERWRSQRHMSVIWATWRPVSAGWGTGGRNSHGEWGNHVDLRTKIGDMLCVIYISSGGLPMNAWWKLEFFWGKHGFNKRRDFIEIALVHLQSHRSIHSARLSFEVTELRNNQFLFSVICSCCGLTSGIASAQTPPPLFSVICICMYVGYLHIHTWTRIYIYICIWFHICVYINTNIYEYMSK